VFALLWSGRSQGTEDCARHEYSSSTTIKWCASTFRGASKFTLVAPKKNGSVCVPGDGGSRVYKKLGDAPESLPDHSLPDRGPSQQKLRWPNRIHLAELFEVPSAIASITIVLSRRTSPGNKFIRVMGRGLAIHSANRLLRIDRGRWGLRRTYHSSYFDAFLKRFEESCSRTFDVVDLGGRRSGSPQSSELFERLLNYRWLLSCAR